MKRLGRVLGSLLAVALTVFTMQAFAAAQTGGRDFNHMTTGFILSGGHAVAACETCHIGGVFKGTPKTCDGCHAIGSRIVATPKSTSHIVTDAPCESCHFNTATWLGARYNHGNSQIGKCESCHNGRIATGRPANHFSGSTVKRVNSCDSCHRTSAWLISGYWNHAGQAIGDGSCNGSGCHINGSGNAYTSATAGSSRSWTHSSFTDTSTKSCDVCHVSFVGWSARTHEPRTGTCSGCHNGTAAEGKHTAHMATTDECDVCHTSTVSWSGALGAKPSNHIPYTSGTCASCHTGSAIKTGATLHAYVSTVCTTCHLKGGTSYLGNMDKKGIGHEGMGTGDDCSMSGCHKPAGNRGTAYINWD